MRTVFLAAALLVATGAVAGAQTSLDQKTPGIVRGIGGVNSSGQNGEFAVYRGSNSVVVNMRETRGKTEAVTIERAFACGSSPRVAFASLGTLHNGNLNVTTPLTLDRLLSGNYNVVVHESTLHSRSVACGHIYLQS